MVEAFHDSAAAHSLADPARPVAQPCGVAHRTAPAREDHACPADRSLDSLDYFDLEDPGNLARLAEPINALADLRGVVVIDEVQREPDLFPVLRVLADRRPLPTRFLILSSASMST